MTCTNFIDRNSHYFALMNPFCAGGWLVDGNKHEWVECKIVEDQYKVDDGYKVTLKPLDSNYASRDFYQCDFISLMEAGRIFKKTDTMHIETEIQYVPITDKVYVVTVGNYIVEG